MYYNGYPIIVFRVEPFNRQLNLYQGEVKLDLPEDKKGIAPSLSNLPQALASLVYGCMFQAVYMLQGLNDCICRNGEWDMNLWRSSLIENDLMACASKFKTVEDDYFKRLQGDQSIHDLLKLDMSQFARADDDGRLEINIVDLRAKTHDFLHQHFAMYQSLVQSYLEVIKIGEAGACLEIR